MDVRRKLQILAAAAKYDVPCAATDVARLRLSRPQAPPFVVLPDRRPRGLDAPGFEAKPRAEPRQLAFGFG